MPLTGLVRKDLPLADGNVRKLIEDASFPNQWPTKETHIQHKVLYKNGVSKEYGVHGTAVGVDFDICIADGICITVCPVNVFDRLELPGEQEKMDKGVTNDSGKAPLANWKADPAREQDCIFCRACEIQCPVQAIKITEALDHYAKFVDRRLFSQGSEEGSYVTQGSVAKTPYFLEHSAVWERE